MIEKGRLVKIYETMSDIRNFELKAQSFFEQNILRGSVHLYVGEEAVAASVCSLLKDEDYITSTHRGHGHCIAKGAELGKSMAELMGKATGYCKGRSGSMHIADFTKGNLGANAVVGAGIPIAVGAALASHLKGTKQVTVSFFGDGASNEGTFHEAINLAAVWKLPVIFVCENNGYGISVPLKESTAVEDISVRAVGYGIPGYTVDGNDVLAIDEVMQKALERAKAGEGPTLIECKTYRWLGHWTGDPQVYRTKEEVEEWKKKDPILILKKYMLDNNILTESEVEKLDNNSLLAVEEAAKFALESPDPDPATVMEDVFFEN
ncbi:thiamine pyrophosphate-dependent dehydrogenase E1 component subunit alpha [Desulfosporosinus metallidurans]|uniref:Acetoin dehydrogenase E1 component alpha-subunit n=1 Tax=Desulfosporosinus metallidurans TaxID=1888891 RepID=A0A1Q8QZG1_9FIRM|nr:thiamine pyrophosphate-dependent dehydrogenase E1 component subunit alpha [Desulfosporosinus metallidurans]OLN32727.1 Acetoin dehydrogenase E1 component alpha-subunit [Desulfosporosinus metallidurans]